MTTVREIIERAHRKITVLARDESLEAHDISHGLDALNMMLAAWKLSGISRTHTTLTLTSTFPLAAEYEEGTVYMLAGRLAPDFSMPANFDADDFFRKVQVAYLTISEVTIPKALKETATQREAKNAI